MRHLTNLLGFVLLLCTMLATSSAFAGDVVRIEGKRFLKDGEPWVAEGVTLVGRVAPAATVSDRVAYARAREKFSPALFDDVKEYGADLIRYQFSQGGLDPLSPIYDPGYRGEVLDAVRQARDAGFIVIVSMQWQGPSGSHDEGGMPTATTDRAWLQIIEDLGRDQGILLEIFNEPSLREPTPENWETWRSDMQDLVYLLRGADAQNVLLVGGLRAAHYLGGAPEIEDPLNQVGYAVHPFLTHINRTKAQWDENFGKFAATHPVMATAFMASSISACDKNIPRRAEQMLEYLHKKQIGMTIWAFDLAVVRQGNKLSNFENFECGKDKRGGAGQMVHDYYMAN